MNRTKRGVVFCAALLLTGLVARADDMVANPAYDGWAKSAVGSSVKYAQETVAMGNTTSGEMTQTLKEVTPDAVKVEMKMSMVIGGNKMDMPANTMTIPAKVAKPADATATPPADAPKADMTTEDVTIDGKTYSCKVATVNMEKNGMKIASKTWSCAQVPGGLVKSESTTSGTVSSTTKMTLKSVDAK